MLRFSLTILAVFTAACSVSVADESALSSRKLDVRVRVQMDYLLSLPDQYSSDGEPSPLLLFLHGAGERGSDLNLVKKHGPPKLIGAGKSFPFIVVAPQCNSDQIWQPYMLTALLDEVICDHNVDENRVYVTGLSMGGFGTWSLAAYTPKRFAAIAPDLWRQRAFPSQIHQRHSCLGVSWSKRFGGTVVSFGRNVRRAQEAQYRRKVDGLSRCRTRFMDGNVQQSGTLQVAAVTFAREPLTVSDPSTLPFLVRFRLLPPFPPVPQGRQ